MTVLAAAVSPAPKVDVNLVPGLKLPVIPGLPGSESPGRRLDELVAPPTPGSVAGKADLKLVQLAQRLRTPQGDAWAVDMDHRGGVKIWMDFAKRHRATSGRAEGWLDTALVAATIASNAAVTQVAKHRYDRDRPPVLDPTIKPPIRIPRDKSYPSGHASSAFAAARVISRIAPELGREAYDMARQVAVSRVYAGVHFPTDVIAGAALGTAVGEAALRLSRRGDVVDAAALASEVAGAAAA